MKAFFINSCAELSEHVNLRSLLRYTSIQVYLPDHGAISEKSLVATAAGRLLALAHYQHRAAHLLLSVSLRNCETRHDTEEPDKRQTDHSIAEKGFLLYPKILKGTGQVT